MKNNSLCPICGEGSLHEKITNAVREHSGMKKVIPLYSSECSECGSDVVNDKQASKNKRLMTDFYKEADGLLTGSEIRKIRVRLNLTQPNASKIFGGGPKAFSKYENDDVTQSIAMDKLLRLAALSNDVFNELCKTSGITTTRSDLTRVHYFGFSSGTETPQPKRDVFEHRALSSWETPTVAQY